LNLGASLDPCNGIDTGLAAMLRICGGLAFAGDMWGKVMSGCGCVEPGKVLEHGEESSGWMRVVKEGKGEDGAEDGRRVRGEENGEGMVVLLRVRCGVECAKAPGTAGENGSENPEAESKGILKIPSAEGDGGRELSE
jgi:hypothetical protein